MRTRSRRTPVRPRLIAVIAVAVTVSTLSVPGFEPAASTPAPARATDRPAPARRHQVPVYRDPAGYAGVRKVPRVRPVGGREVTLSAAGSFPHTYVDEAGTAHIVWNEDRGDAADVTVYCRLRRGASGCDHRAELTWTKAYDAGDGPQFNTDPIGPRIVRIGDQLLALSFRYPTFAAKPDGQSSSSTLVGWLSQDGGTTWSDAVVLGDTRLGQVVAIGPDTDPVVVNVGEDPYCPPAESPGQICVSSTRSAGYDARAGTLNPDGDTDYFPSIVADAGTAVMAMGDSVSLPDATIRVRRWNGRDPVTDPANWTMSAPIAGAQPELAAGPSGVYLLQASVGADRPLQVRRLTTATGGVMTPGAPVTVAPESDDRHELVQDAAGRLHAVYADLDRSRLSIVSTRPGGTRFGSPTVVVSGAPGSVDIAQHDVAVTADGGGFVVANRTGGVTGPGQIVAAPVGSLAPTGRPGLGNLPGGGNVSCTRVGFGAFDLRAEAGCFFKGTGSRKNVVVTRNAVELNGLEIVPTPGSSLVVDAKRLTIDTVGQARVLLRNKDATIELFKGRIARNLSGLRPGDRLFEFPPELYRTDILGFPVASGMPVELTKHGVRIPVEVKLPRAFGKFTGRAVLLGRQGEGLKLDSLHIAMGPIGLGVASFGAKVDWASDASWTGSGTISVPAGGTFKAEVAFDHGRFVSADFDYDPRPPLPVGPFVFLTSVGGGLTLDPVTQLRVRGSLGAPLPVEDAYPVVVDGTATMTFPDTGPARFRMDGHLHLFFVDVAKGDLEFFTDGYAQFHGDTVLDLGPLSGGAQLNGFVDAVTGRFGADMSGHLDLCIDFPVVGEACAGVRGDTAVSSTGFAVCAGFKLPKPVGTVTGGIATRWEDFDPLALANPALMTAEVIGDIAIPCHTDAYRIPPPRAARGVSARTTAAGGTAFTIRGGLPTATLRVPGQGGTPTVRVTGPDGTVLAGPEVRRRDAFVATVKGADAAWVVLRRPAAGTYTVTPVAGSVPLGAIRLSEGYRPATVHARLVRPRHHRKHRRDTGRAPRTMAIRYRIAHLGHGQRVEFREHGRFGTRVLGTVRHAGRGSFRFRTRVLRGRRRTVEAVVLHRGLGQDRIRVGRYRGRVPTKPGRVHRLRVRRHGSHLVVRFRPAPHAARTVVTVRGDAGSRFVRTLTGRHHRLRLDGLRWDRKITVRVRAWSADARPGRPRTVHLRPRQR